MKILFVCTGNTCRSPMAEALLKHKYPQASVRSAGIFAGRNEPANQFVKQALQERRIEEGHQSQPVTEDILHWADLVITMTTQHKQSLIVSYPDLQEKYFTLKEYVSDADRQIWDELKKAYADLEEKRSHYIYQHQHRLDNNVLEKNLREHLQPDMDAIHHLEAQLMDYDISDPFGGDYALYRDTLEELERHIDELVDKLEKNGKT